MLFPTFALGWGCTLQPGIINVFGGEALRPKETFVGVAQRELDGEELLDDKLEKIDERAPEP